MIPGVVIDRAAHAILQAEHPEASGWSGKPEAVKDRYRRMALAALESAQPDEELLGFVGVECSGCPAGGFFPAGGWTPVDDDGQEFTYDGRDWTCARCAQPTSPQELRSDA